MRIKTDTPELLVLEDRPLLVALLLSAFVLLDVVVEDLRKLGEKWGLTI